MTHRMSIFRRKPDLEPAAFRAYWRDVHAPIAVTIPALQRYEQNCAVEHHHSGDPERAQPVDGVCKLEFADESAMKGVMTPEMTRVLMEDEAKFIEGLRTFVVRPSVFVPLAAGAVTKCMALVTRRKELDPMAFEQRWSGAFAGWIAAQPGIAGYAQYFVTARTAERKPASYEQVPIDCVDEIWLCHPVGSDAARDLIRAIEQAAAAHTEALNLSVVTVNVPPIPHGWEAGERGASNERSHT